MSINSSNNNNQESCIINLFFYLEKKMCFNVVSGDVQRRVSSARNNGVSLQNSYNLISFHLDKHEANDFLTTWYTAAFSLA